MLIMRLYFRALLEVFRTQTLAPNNDINKLKIL